MQKRERPSILDLCPTCGSPKPCVLHDEKFLEGLLEPERTESIYDLMEKTAEWDQGSPVTFVKFITKTDALVASEEGKIELFDFTNPHEPNRAELGEFDGAVSDIVPLPDSRLFVIGWNKEHHGIMSVIDTIAGMTVSSQEKHNHFFKAFPLSDAEILVTHNVVAPDRVTLSNNSFIDSQPERNIGAIFEMHRLSGSKILAWNVDNELILNDIEEATKDVLHKFDFTLSTITILSDTSVLVGKEDGKICFVDFTDSENVIVQELANAEEGIRKIEFLNDSVAIVGDVQGNLYYLAMSETPKIELKKIGNIGSEVLRIEKISETRVLVSGSETNLELWEVPEEKIKKFHERKIEEEIEEMPEW